MAEALRYAQQQADLLAKRKQEEISQKELKMRTEHSAAMRKAEADTIRLDSEIMTERKRLQKLTLE